MTRPVSRPVRRSAAAAVAAVLSLAALPALLEGASSAAPLGAAPSGATARGAGPGPGKAGSEIVLATQKHYAGNDIAMGGNGTAYVGWIDATTSGSADRTVHLCVLPKGATACQGGVQSTPSLGPSSAAGLQVLPPAGASPVTLIWFHDTVDSINGPLNAKVATSTVQPNGTLNAAGDVAAAPSFGSLQTAERGPGGAIWVVLQNASSSDNLRVLPGLAGTPKIIDPPWLVGKARLAFANGKAVIVFDRYGEIGDQVRVIHQTNTGWSSISPVGGTWNVGGAFDVANRGGVKLVAPINNASYYPRIASWTGSAFGPFTLTGDKNSCYPSSHDLFPDASGRLADVAFECTQVTIANHPKAKTAAFVRFNVGGTPVIGLPPIGPQIGTNPRGLGWVAWARQSTPTGNTLLVAPIRLPAQLTQRSETSIAGTVTVKGPVSCLPAVLTTIGVSAAGKNGWSVIDKTLRLDGSVHGPSLNGAALAPGSMHTVTGSARFAKGGQRQTLTAKLTFKACPNP